MIGLNFFFMSKYAMNKNTLLLWFVYGIKFTNGGNKMNDEEKILKLLNNNNGVIKTSEVTDKKMKKMYYIN